MKQKTALRQINDILEVTLRNCNVELIPIIQGIIDINTSFYDTEQDQITEAYSIGNHNGWSSGKLETPRKSNESLDYFKNKFE